MGCKNSIKISKATSCTCMLLIFPSDRNKNGVHVLQSSKTNVMIDGPDLIVVKL